MSSVSEALDGIRSRIKAAYDKLPREKKGKGEPRLVAVSKMKPVGMIVEAYAAGQRHFGENYADELILKASDQNIVSQCPNIKWHFIGRLQSKKASKVASIPALHVVETVDSKNTASVLNKAIEKMDKERLKVFLQVNTSGEENKNGISPDTVVDLAKFVAEKCPKLCVSGLMTIGQFGRDNSQGPNPDFLSLVKCKEEVSRALNIKDMELSMGMSDDFEHAIELGSTNVRVGSSIFGHRSASLE